MKDDTLYRIHISECVDRIFSYVHGMDESAFHSSFFTQDAVWKMLFFSRSKSGFPLKTCGNDSSGVQLRHTRGSYREISVDFDPENINCY